MDTAIQTSGISSVRVRWQWLIPVGLALLALLVFANTFGYELLHSWDDNRYIKENMLLRDFSPQGIADIFTQVYFAAYIPVTIFSYAIEYQLWGLDPTGYHVVNVLLNALNAGLVYLFLYRLLGSRLVAIIATLLFIVHPVQVESVAWVSQRKNLLSMMFTLLAFLLHMHSAKDDSPRWTLPLGWFMYLLAALAKPAVVGVPILFIAYDYFWAKLTIRQIIQRNLVPLAIGAFGAVSIILAHKSGGGIKEYRGGSVLTTAGVMMIVYWDYLVALLAPFNLDNFYQYPVSILSQYPLSVALGGLLMVGTAIFAWKQPLGKPFSLFAVLWIWLFLLPVSNIIPIAIERADRYMYFPSIVIFALVGIMVERLWNAFTSPNARYAIIGVVAIVLVGLGVLTVNRNEVWRTEGILWSDHLTNYPDSETGWLNLGVYQFNTRDYANALPTFERLLELDPTHFKGNRFMGHIAYSTERYADALPYYHKALEREPDDSISNNYLALSYYRLGNWQGAVDHYRRALAEDASLNQAYINLGDAAIKIQDYPLAKLALLDAAERNPDNAEVWSNLCTAHAELDELPEAANACGRAAQLEQDNGVFLGRYAHLLLETDRPSDALPVAQRAVSVAPNLSLAHRVLGESLANLGEVEPAIAEFRRALELDPNNARAQAGLTALLVND